MKKELLLELVKLTKQQAVALQEEDIDEFIRLLDQRQEVLDKLETLKKEHPEIQNEDCSEIIQQLQQVDNENRKEFEKQFNDVKNKLKDIRKKKNSEERYTRTYDTSWEEGVFFDKRERR